MKLDANKRYELLAELYYRQYGEMAPGKDRGYHSPQSDEERAENYMRWYVWINGDQPLERALEALLDAQERSR
jgi:hypothetical protein